MKQFFCFRFVTLFIFFSAPYFLQAQTQLTIHNEIQTFESLVNTTVTMSGESELHLTNSTNPLSESEIILQSDDAWVFFDKIKPSVASAQYLKQIKTGTDAAVLNKNVRVVQYLNGAVIIPHAPDFAPLTVFADSAYGGASLELVCYDFYTGEKLTAGMENNISSFKLKRGYMATFATEATGAGYSQVFIAQDNDIEIEKLPAKLNDLVSFIRVFPWRWVNKKGWAGSTVNDAGALNCAWRYDWNNEASSTPDVEYIPMRHNPNWNSYSNITNKKNTTHALHFNEPDNSGDDGYSTVQGALAQWPQLLQSGLRLGSPAPTDGGLSWLYDFIDQADALNYRVDFVAVHFYKGGWSATQLYNWLKGIHERTGRPIWVTEWNNGANWTSETWPDEIWEGGERTERPYTTDNAQKQLSEITEFLEVLDAAPFVERYSIYNWVQDCRAMILSNNLTLAGEYYRDNESPMAYSDPGKAPEAPVDLIAKAVSSTQINLIWTDASENEAGFRIERRTGLEEFAEIARVGSNIRTYADKMLLSATEYSYRVVAYNSIGSSLYSNVAIDTTHAGLGFLSQEGWKLHYVDSQETIGEDGRAKNAFDGNPNSFWHTEWDHSSPRPPHEIQIDLGNKYMVGGFLYLPRQDGNLNGTIADYEFYLGLDGERWGLAASGKWAANNSEKKVEFEPIKARYIRLVGKSEVNNNAWSCVAELNVLIEGGALAIDVPNPSEAGLNDFRLGQNYPNPFNMQTTLNFAMPRTTHIKLEIFDILGHHIRTIIDQEMPIGYHGVNWNGQNSQGEIVSSGIYFCRLISGNTKRIIKIQLLK